MVPCHAMMRGPCRDEHASVTTRSPCVRPTIGLACLALALAALPVAAASGPTSPYRGQEARAIKALAPEQIEGLLAGKGLGYAKAAELNGYPGPAHVLELAGPLQLSETQLEATRAIHARMQARAMALGARLVDAEAELERLFAGDAASEAALASLPERIAAIQAELRGTHLVAHIEQRRLLSPEQVAHYARLRGYRGHGQGHDGGHGHGHAHGHAHEHGHGHGGSGAGTFP